MSTFKLGTIPSNPFALPTKMMAVVVRPSREGPPRDAMQVEEIDQPAERMPPAEHRDSGAKKNEFACDRYIWSATRASMRRSGRMMLLAVACSHSSWHLRWRSRPRWSRWRGPADHANISVVSVADCG